MGATARTALLLPLAALAGCARLEGYHPKLQQLATALDDQAAAKLYQKLIAPFEEKLAAAKTVYVAPDGILNRKRVPADLNRWDS